MTSIPYQVYPDSATACSAIASEIASMISRNNARDRTTVLGLATGGTPLPLYRELIRHGRAGLSFAKVTTFNLDEYFGLKPSDPNSYWHFMWSNFFDHIDIPAENVFIPKGDLLDGQVALHCQQYERRILEAGGIDYQILGIGRNGHIGFNEPGSPESSQTRLVHLDAVTRVDAAPGFGDLSLVPRTAITMGCSTIMGARKIAVLAWGNNKAQIVRSAIVGRVTPDIPASYLQKCPDVRFHLDAGSASLLPSSLAIARPS